MAPRRTAELEDISMKVLSYLAEHPLAQDTLEGIVEWWLLEQQIQHWTPNVEAALASLIKQKLVLERKGQDRRSHYRLNRRKLKAIRKSLQADGAS